MTYFECEGCGHLADFVRFDTRERWEHCPVCERQTRWTIAFEDRDAGVTF